VNLGIYLNFLEIIGLTYAIGIILSLSIIIGFFMIVSRVGAIARDTETIKNYLLNEAEKKKRIGQQ
jgi:ABC-type nickel/cobalt efflux system permease component RcnA